MSSYLYNALEGEFNIGGPGGGGGGGGNAEKWTAVVDSTPVLMTQNGFYYVNAGVDAVLVLPVTAKAGSRNRIEGGIGSTYTIQQNAGQQIVFANQSTEVGVDGFVTGGGTQAIELLVTVANELWIALSGAGNVILQIGGSTNNATNPAGIDATGLVQYNKDTGVFGYASGSDKGDMVAFNAVAGLWQKLAVIANQCFWVADSSQTLGWRTSTVQETSDGEMLSGLGQVDPGPVVVKASYSPLLNPATGLVFPTQDQAGLSANGALGFLARQFGVDSNLLHNFYAGVTWNYFQPSSYPYTFSGGNLVIEVDTSTTANTVLLPNSLDFGRLAIVADGSNNASVNNFTVTTPGGTVLLGGSTSQTGNVDGGAFIFQWDGAQYILLNRLAFEPEGTLYGTASTTSAPDVQTIISFNLGAAAAAYQIKVETIARGTNGALVGVTGAFETLSVYTDGVTASLVDPVDIQASTVNLTTFTAYTSVSGNNVLVRAFGSPSYNVNWKSILTYVKVA